ncbi:MAG: aminodeoxychorismate lyase [Idiomarina sp.]|nr:aminodeoxychorismate lyase [Idiomarina sp.]
MPLFVLCYLANGRSYRGIFALTGVTLINGQASHYVAVNDRGLQYGDGFFTTLRVAAGRLVQWPAHIARLQTCAQRLGFNQHDPQLQPDTLYAQCLRAIDGASEAVVRITVTRGVGGRGYAPPQDATLQVIVAASDYPSHYANWQSQGVCLHLARQQVGHQPSLNGLKTLNRLEQVLAKQELADYPDADDVLLLNTREQVTATSMANIIWSRAGQWYAPDLAFGGIKGTATEFFARQHKVEFGAWSLDALIQAEHVIICNALMGFVSVGEIRQHATRSTQFSVISDFTQQLTTHMCQEEP